MSLGEYLVTEQMSESIILGIYYADLANKPQRKTRTHAKTDDLDFRCSNCCSAIGHLHDDVIYYYDQNPSGFCFLVQIRAFAFETSLGIPN